MSAHCRALKVVPMIFGAAGQLDCDLASGHDGAMHFDRDLLVWWLPVLPSERPEDLPSFVRMNEDMPAVLAGEWGNR